MTRLSLAICAGWRLLAGIWARRSRRRASRIDPAALSDTLRRDLGFQDGRPTRLADR